MLKYSRNLVLDIYDYSENHICNLYDRTTDASGQATDVFVINQRNGFKELQFTIPSTMVTQSGQERNFRLDYVIAGYKIRLQDDDGIDWFIVSGPKTTHKNFSQDLQVVAEHNGMVLKTKNLGLEFSDEEGNNVGTAKELLDTILEGTGWKAGNVDEFKEDDGTIKKRSLVAPSKTGAFSLISKMCSLFDAKPIYNGDSKTVDIKPMNPFSRPEDGSLPQVADKDVLELYYGNNVSNITRTLNTQNMITKLYAYGSFGDVDLGYCGLDECQHTEYVFTTTMNMTEGNTYNIQFTDSTGVDVHRHFTATEDVPSGSRLIFSELDYASMMYLWNEDTQKAYLLNDGSLSAYTNLTYTKETKKEKNYFSFLMDFRYYQQVGLFDDYMLQMLAMYQRKAPQYYQATSDASAAFDLAEQNLFTTVGTADFCRLNVTSVGTNGDYYKINLTETEQYPKGIMYSSQYDTKIDKWFKWRTATAVKPNGESVNEEASVLYIIRTAPNKTTWIKCYIKQMSEDKKELTLWVPKSGNSIAKTDRFYLFSQNSVSGNLGAYEVLWMANNATLDSITTVVTAKHPVFIEPTGPVVKQFDEYAWFSVYPTDNIYAAKSILYFWNKLWNDTGWKRVYIGKDVSEFHTNSYFFDITKNKLYKAGSTAYEEIEDTAQNKRLFSTFSSVIYYCEQQEFIYQETYEKYKFVPTSVLKKGNYYIDTGYGQYKLFSTTQDIPTTGSLVYDTAKTTITQNADSGTGEVMLTTKSYQYNTVTYQPSNVVRDTLFSHCDLTSDGKDIQDGSGDKKMWSTKYFNVFPQLVYYINSTEPNLGSGYCFTVYFFDNELNFISSYNLQNNSGILTPKDCYHMRMRIRMKDTTSITDATKYNIHASNYDKTIISQDQYYKYLSSWKEMTPSGTTRSLPTMIKKFANYADDAYITKYKDKKEKQQQQADMENSFADALGQIYKEGYWQKADYVDGDEDKLYKDAMDNLNQIAKPQKKYTVTYLDLYGSDYEHTSVDELTAIEWPDVSIDKAVHLIDESIDVNEWAFIDKIQKCYDKPWQTKLEINTNLSTMAQHTFSDVMSHIAQIANQMKAKETKYDKAITANSSGQMATDLLEGSIDANRIKILGGDSTWYTDSHGNIVFESADGTAAILITGNGMLLSDSLDEWGDHVWRTAITGHGICADEINTGFLSAERILAGSITVDKISPTVGGQLQISANPTINGIDTRITIAEGKIEQIVQKTNKTYYQTTNPIDDPNVGKDKLLKGDYWVKPTTYTDPDTEETTDAVQNYVWTGTEWRSIDASTMVLSESSRITQTADQITQQVTRATEAQGNLDSKITQTAEDILVEVQDNYYGKKSSVKIESDGIHILTSGKLEMQGSSSINMSSDADINVNGGSINLVGGDINVDGTSKVSINGGSIDMNSDSSLSLTGGSDITLEGGNIQMKSGSSIDVEGGNINLKSEGNLTVDGGNVQVKSNGSVSLASGSNLNVNGGNINLTTGGNFNVSGANVLLNSNGRFTVQGGASVDILANGNFTVNSNNFKIDPLGNVYMSGTINANNGYIGGWNISPTGLSANNGSVGLAPTTNATDVAFWSGNNNKDTAPFRVLQDGTVVLTRLKTQDDQGVTTNVDLTTYPFWKLYYATVKSMAVQGDVLHIETTSGSIDFKKAAVDQLVGNWSGNTYTVKAYSSGIQTNLTLNTSVQGPFIDADSVKFSGSGRHGLYTVPMRARGITGDLWNTNGTFIPTEAVDYGYSQALTFDNATPHITYSPIMSRNLNFGQSQAVNIYWSGQMYKSISINAPVPQLTHSASGSTLTVSVLGSNTSDSYTLTTTGSSWSGVEFKVNAACGGATSSYTVNAATVYTNGYRNGYNDGLNIGYNRGYNNGVGDVGLTRSGMTISATQGSTKKSITVSYTASSFKKASYTASSFTGGGFLGYSSEYKQPVYASYSYSASSFTDAVYSPSSISFT